MTVKPTKPSARIARAEAALAAHAASYPEVREDAPWGHRAFKVKAKTFLFMGSDGDGLGLSTKLPHSANLALTFPFAKPTHYGLGKSGWVSAEFGPKDDVPIELMREWIDESFRAIAPKKLVASLGSSTNAKPQSAAKRARPSKKKSVTQKKKKKS